MKHYRVDTRLQIINWRDHGFEGGRLYPDSLFTAEFANRNGNIMTFEVPATFFIASGILTNSFDHMKELVSTSRSLFSYNELDITPPASDEEPNLEDFHVSSGADDVEIVNLRPGCQSSSPAKFTCVDPDADLLESCDDPRFSPQSNRIEQRQNGESRPGWCSDPQKPEELNMQHPGTLAVGLEILRGCANGKVRSKRYNNKHATTTRASFVFKNCCTYQLLCSQQVPYRDQLGELHKLRDAVDKKVSVHWQTNHHCLIFPSGK